MQKFGALSDWRILKSGKAIEITKSRTVRMKVCTPNDTTWMVTFPGGKSGGYLTTTSGHETLEFHAKAGTKIAAAKDARYSTAWGNTIHVENQGKETFTTIANREARNPELERVAHIAAINATNRIFQMQAEEKRRAELRTPTKADTSASVPAASGSGSSETEGTDTEAAEGTSTGAAAEEEAAEASEQSANGDK